MASHVYPFFLKLKNVKPVKKVKRIFHTLSLLLRAHWKRVKDELLNINWLIIFVNT